MSITASRRSTPAGSRPWVALAIAGWLAVSGLSLPVDLTSEPAQSPEMSIQATPVKAYSG